MSPLEQIGSRFDGFTKNGNGYHALCPCHDDNSPSLSINKGKNGKILLRCHAECKTSDILDIVGLKMSDLNGKQANDIEAEYNYTTKDGMLVFQVVRYSNKRFAQRKPKKGGAGWTNSVNGIEKVIYNLSAISRYKKNTVYFCEGEKDANRLIEMGLSATAIAGGASAEWEEGYGDSLKNRNVVFLLDNDSAGFGFGNRNAKELHGIAKSVKVVLLPGLSEKGDVSDWVDAGGNAKQLQGIVRKALEYDPGKPVKRKIKTASMVDVDKIVEDVEFLIDDFVPLGMLTKVLAPPGFGKSALTLYGIARPILEGNTKFFNGQDGPKEPGYVMWCDTEGSASITLTRLKQWGIPFEKMLVPFADDPLRPIDLTKADDLERIEDLVQQHKIKLVVIDSLRGAHDGDENSSRISKVLNALVAIAVRTQTAILITHHCRKLGEGEEVTADSSRGSNSIFALCRAQLGIDKPDPESKWHRLRMLKENLGISPGPVGFEVTSDGLNFGDAPVKKKKKSNAVAKMSAEEFLLGKMEPGKWYLAKKLQTTSLLSAISPKGPSVNKLPKSVAYLGLIS